MSLSDKCKQISLFLTDVDGVLTDGRLYYSAEGDVMKAFNVKDGMGVKLLQRSGIKVGIVTGRTSDMVAIRASELGVDIVYQGINDKKKAIMDILNQLEVAPVHTAYIGDDINDLPAFEIAGLSACPADGVNELKKEADYVCESEGGRGAFRELADLILNSKK